MKSKIALRTALSFLALLLFFGAAYGLWAWAWQREDIGGGVPSPFYRALDANGAFWHALSRADAESHPHLPPPVGQAPRVNGDIGLEEYSEDNQKIVVIANDHVADSRKEEFTVADFKKMPRRESDAEFRCIEGWSAPIRYAGVRFSDFLKFTGFGSPWKAPSITGELLPKDLYPYVGLETPDGKYYVSIDMESMLNPQTMLAYEMNGLPLPEENGAPLRLIIPVKYGIKNLKRIGKIFFSLKRPRDYWAEQGYDWFSGL